MKKFAVCVESSRQKGMGHLFRALNFIDFLRSRNQEYLLVINNDVKSVSFLNRQGVRFITSRFKNLTGAWEHEIIKKYKIDVWINDRLDTSIYHAKKVKSTGIFLVCLDDGGSGAQLADINFGCLPFSFKKNLKGKKVLKGIKYLILNKEIQKNKRIRSANKKILVILGGSDTYGVSLKVARALNDSDKKITFVTGPLFDWRKELKDICRGNFVIKESVHSLIKEFVDHDLAITGGGITPFEANASGLPCIVIASELFEVPNCLFLENLGSCVYAGFRSKIDNGIFYRELDIKKMSILGVQKLNTCGAENIYKEINLLFR